jgi:hypothetical protein
MLSIAQKDFGDAPEAYLVYSKGDLEISPDDLNPVEILPRHVDEIIKQAGDPGELNNLVFSVSQATPMRKIEIRIGFGSWTTYRIESDDQTWAFGRYHEITDKLMTDRNLYAKFRSSQPEILKEGTDDKWRTTVWEVRGDWRELFVGMAAHIPLLPIVLAVAYAVSVIGYAVASGSNAAERQDHRQALHDAHVLAARSSIITILVIAYIFTLFAYERWLRGWLRSKIVTRKSLLSEFSFRDRGSGAVALATLYVAAFTFIVYTTSVLLK